MMHFELISSQISKDWQNVNSRGLLRSGNENSLHLNLKKVVLASFHSFSGKFNKKVQKSKFDNFLMTKSVSPIIG